MEVSSHGIDQDRIAGIKFAGGFYHLTHDLDYHQSFKIILRPRRSSSIPAGDAFAISNADDEHGEIDATGVNARKFSMAFNHNADFKGEIVKMDFRADS